MLKYAALAVAGATALAGVGGTLNAFVVKVRDGGAAIARVETQAAELASCDAAMARLEDRLAGGWRADDAATGRLREAAAAHAEMLRDLAARRSPPPSGATFCRPGCITRAGR